MIEYNNKEKLEYFKSKLAHYEDELKKYKRSCEYAISFMQRFAPRRNSNERVDYTDKKESNILKKINYYESKIRSTEYWIKRGYD